MRAMRRGVVVYEVRLDGPVDPPVERPSATETTGLRARVGRRVRFTPFAFG
jgi:hypothetical protein